VSSHGVPKFGKVRFTIDWTTEDAQHLLVVSTVDVFSPLSTVVVISVCHARRTSSSDFRRSFSTAVL